MQWVVRVAVVLTLAGVARGEPYWIAYEADGVPTGNTGGVFPEDQGWAHVWEGTPERWLEDGALVIDSLGSTNWVEFYRWDMDGGLDPGPGEVFVVQWRLCVDVATGEDLSIGVFSDESWVVGLVIDEDSVRNLCEPGVSAGFQAGVFHAFELRSSDMRTYRLFIDGELEMQGSFRHLVTQSQVSWGDGAQGAASLSRWDYFRFGVVPQAARSSFAGGVVRSPPPLGPDGPDAEGELDGSSAGDAPAAAAGPGSLSLDRQRFGGAPGEAFEEPGSDGGK